MIWCAAAVALLLATVAPTPAWLGLVIAALGATAVRAYSTGWFAYTPCDTSNQMCSHLHTTAVRTEGAEYSRAYSTQLETGGIFGTGYGPGLEFSHAALVVIAIGVLAWGIRRRSWRVIVAAALFGLAIWAIREQAPLVLFAAAAAAAGPRQDAHYLAGLGILALTLTGDESEWQLLITIITLTAGIVFAAWALLRKNGVNGAVAIATMATAPLTPFLSAGVLLAAAAYRKVTQANG